MSQPTYPPFQGGVEGPHGSTHGWVGGDMGDVMTSPHDPTFFLLHCNVDRLWAKWQKKFGRFDAGAAGSFVSTANPIGHDLADTMWPWNGVTGGDRPNTAPGNGIPPAAEATAPPRAPTVGNMIDYQGRLDPTSWEGFDYDDIEC